MTFEKIKNMASSAVDAVKGKMIISGQPIMWIVFIYMFLVFLLIAAYFAAWLYKSYHGDIVMTDLLNIIREVTGASMIACVTFIAGCFVDLDHDGIPDKFENNK